MLQEHGSGLEFSVTQRALDCSVAILGSDYLRGKTSLVACCKASLSTLQPYELLRLSGHARL